MCSLCETPKGLDPGIEALVLALRSQGFNTTDSGDGYSKPPDERVFECRHVIITLDDDDTLEYWAQLLQQWLDQNGYREFAVEASFRPRDGKKVLIALEE